MSIISIRYNDSYQFRQYVISKLQIKRPDKDKRQRGMPGGSMQLEQKYLGKQELINWVRQINAGPCSRKARGMADLRSGVIIGEILVSLLPQQCVQELSKNIEISNIDSESSIRNLTTIKQTLVRWAIMWPNISTQGYSAEGLYYRQYDMLQFMNKIIRPLAISAKTISQLRHSSTSMTQIEVNADSFKAKQKVDSSYDLKLKQTHSQQRKTQGQGPTADKAQSHNRGKLMHSHYHKENGVNNYKNNQNKMERISANQNGKQQPGVNSGLNNNKYLNMNISQLSDIANSTCIDNRQLLNTNTNNRRLCINTTKFPQSSKQSRISVNYGRNSSNTNNTNICPQNHPINKKRYHKQNCLQNEKKQHLCLKKERKISGESENCQRAIYNRPCAQFQTQQQIQNKEQTHILTAQIYDKKQQNQTIDSQQIQALRQWVKIKLPADSQFQQQQHQVLAHLVNAIFSDSRLGTPILKSAHFEQAPQLLFRKIFEFLLINPISERFPKHHTVDCMKSMENDGQVKESQYWLVIRDLKNYDLSRGRARSLATTRRFSPHLKSKNAQDKFSKRCNQQSQDQEFEKQNYCVNRIASNRSIAKSKAVNKQKILNNEQLGQVSKCMQWLITQMGYQHSLTKSKANFNVLQNPLLNGTLISSILMRFKIGKPNISKHPQSTLQVYKNWDQIKTILSIRGYSSFKHLALLLSQIQADEGADLIPIYLSELWQLKVQYQTKNPQTKSQSFIPITKRNGSEPNICHNCNGGTFKQTKESKLNICNFCPSTTKIVGADKHNTDQKYLRQWVYMQVAVQIAQGQLSSKQLTQICRLILNIKVCKETTEKIRVSNVQKVLAQMRRIGFTQYYQVKSADVIHAPDDRLRWKILADLVSLIDGKVQFTNRTTKRRLIA